MNYRKLLGEVTPPALARIARRIWRRSHGLGWHVYYGSWQSLADVPVTEDPFVAGRLQPNWRGLDFGNKDAVNIDLNGLILPIIAATYSQPVTVLDFGGGVAAGLASLKNYATVSRFSYVLVETPAFLRIIRDAVEHQPDCSISETIPDVLPHPLIINAAGVIQLIPDYRGVLAQLTRLRPEFFIIARITLTDGQTYARQVLEGPWHKYAQWVFNRADFISEMRSLGYEPVFTTDHDLPIDHGHAPGPSVIASLIFAPVKSA